MVIKNIAVIGAGYWGKNLVRVMNELGVLRKICDKDNNILTRMKTQYKNIDITNNYKEVLENKDINAVVIATPASTHYNLVQESLIAGKDVLVEKPLALKLEDAQELVDIACKNNRVLMVGHILQYHPAVKKLKELIFSGYLGKLQYIYSNRLNIGKLRTEENILWSFAPHDISVILSITQELPLRVNASGEAYVQKDIYDVTLTVLEFPSQVKTHIFVSWIHPFKEQRLVVIGSKKMVVFDDTSVNEKVVIYPHTIEWRDGKIPETHIAEKEVISIEKSEPLKSECEHFLSCVHNRTQPLTDGLEAINVLRVLHLAEKSLKSSGSYFSSKEQDEYYIHPSSILDDNVEIGKGTKIWHFSHILSGSRIGKNCNIGQNVVIGPEVIIGDGCKIQNNVSVYKGVTLEDYVFCGPSCVFTNVINPRSEIRRMDELKPTLVKMGASIGANATILCGNVIGKYSFIGAGSVVTKDVPDYALIYGSPARIKGWVCECSEKLNFENNRAWCKICGKKYTMSDNIITRIQ
ncbi:MAG: Gfo/Idh/MocA family oxidoreductase [Candidatus Hydrogenedentota bacterium]